MKILNSIISYLKLIKAGICLLITGALCGIDPKNELKYRKKCSHILTNMIAKEVIIEGEIDKNANIFLGNHTHNLDIALFESVIDEKTIWIAKAELGKIPVIKYMLTKTDMILVDRSNKASTIKMIREIKDRIKRNLKIAAFPEGTRNKKNPKKLLPFKKGLKGVVEKLNLKVQPFVIINLPFAFKKNPFRVEKQTIKVIFLPSFYPKDNPNWYEDMREKMQEILNKEYKKC
ncbi:MULTISPECIES: lysophospholipid acyltransferase family protein [unclassified Lebetimonas]|uniref:lysophospholipid acyltransferase family protein n=1 Tax=unclassified Lebetimonas TaxID=2648158 RepID=UPI000463539D|nr:MULTISPECIES: lysophospholipid acyltransferase family protein [unclassified Lebetimonas]